MNKIKKMRPWLEGPEVATMWQQLEPGDHVEVRVAPATDPIWIIKDHDDDNEPFFGDAESNAVDSAHMAIIVMGKTFAGEISRDSWADDKSIVRVSANDAEGDESWISLKPAHVVAFRKVDGPVSLDLGGGTLELRPDGTADLDGETVSRKELLALRRALDEHFAD